MCDFLHSNLMSFAPPSVPMTPRGNQKRRATFSPRSTTASPSSKKSVNLSRNEQTIRPLDLQSIPSIVFGSEHSIVFPKPSVSTKRPRLSINIPEPHETFSLKPSAAARVEEWGLSPLANTDVSEMNYSASVRKGRRRHLQDTFCVVPALPNSAAAYAVFDGHGDYGESVAKFCAQFFESEFVKVFKPANGDSTADNINVKLTNLFENANEECNKKLEDRSSGGSTAICCYVDHAAKKIVTANAGDCRCVLVQKTKVVPLSTDHKPDCDKEKARVEAAGGHLLNAGSRLRVGGVLAVTRSIGDRKYSDYVIATPEIQETDFDDDNEFLVIGSDGLFGVLSDEKIAEILRLPDSAVSRSHALVSEALAAGSNDNVSAVVVDLRGKPGNTPPRPNLGRNSRKRPAALTITKDASQ